MCIAIGNGYVGKYAPGNGLCIEPVCPFALYQLTEFVIKLDAIDSQGNYENWFIQRMEGKIIGALAYAAIIIANVVECVVLLALGLLALLPSLMVKNGFERALGTCLVSVMFFFEIPVRAVSGIIQNILLGCRKDFEELHLGSICATSLAFEEDAKAAARADVSHPRLLGEMP
jgi:hypothetical protein